MSTATQLRRSFYCPFVLVNLFFKLLRKNRQFVWNEDRERAFEKITIYLLKSHILVPPLPGCPLLSTQQTHDSSSMPSLAYLADMMK